MDANASKLIIMDANASKLTEEIVALSQNIFRSSQNISLVH